MCWCAWRGTGRGGRGGLKWEVHSVIPTVLHQSVIKQPRSWAGARISQQAPTSTPAPSPLLAVRFLPISFQTAPSSSSFFYQLHSTFINEPHEYPQSLSPLFIFYAFNSLDIYVFFVELYVNRYSQKGNLLAKVFHFRKDTNVAFLSKGTVLTTLITKLLFAVI